MQILAFMSEIKVIKYDENMGLPTDNGKYGRLQLWQHPDKFFAQFELQFPLNYRYLLLYNVVDDYNYGKVDQVKSLTEIFALRVQG